LVPQGVNLLSDSESLLFCFQLFGTGFRLAHQTVVKP
jgi:hypothetical protein